MVVVSAWFGLVLAGVLFPEPVRGAPADIEAAVPLLKERSFQRKAEGIDMIARSGEANASALL